MVEMTVTRETEDECMSRRQKGWIHVSTRQPRPRSECASVGQRRGTTDPLWHQCGPTELARDARSRPDGRRVGIRFILAHRSSHARSRLLDDLSRCGRCDADHPARDTRELRRLSAPGPPGPHGRLVLGLGSGDMPREFQQLGIAYPTIQERQAALEGAIGIIRPLLRGETVTFAGKHHRADGAVLQPPPVQQPYIPLLIAGGSERTTLRYVAQYADMSSMAAASQTFGDVVTGTVESSLLGVF